MLSIWNLVKQFKLYNFIMTEYFMVSKMENHMDNAHFFDRFWQTVFRQAPTESRLHHIADVLPQINSQVSLISCNSRSFDVKLCSFERLQNDQHTLIKSHNKGN